MTLIPSLDLIAFTIISPAKSIIFIKSMTSEKKLLAKLIGHKGKEPPCILYVENSGCLVSGERSKPYRNR
jgi:hypothetical protein